MKKDDYIVYLLSPMGKKYGKGHSFPTDYVYQLKEDFRPDKIYVCKNIRGSKQALTNKPGKAEIRPANEAEIAAYKYKGGPVPAIPETIVETYSIY